MTQRTTPRQIGSLARSKAARECSRPEHDLRVLLGHIQVLDRLERSPADLYLEQQAKPQPPSSVQHNQDSTRCRPTAQKRKITQTLTKGQSDELLVGPSVALISPAALVTVAELGEDDWD